MTGKYKNSIEKCTERCIEKSVTSHVIVGKVNQKVHGGCRFTISQISCDIY